MNTSAKIQHPDWLSDDDIGVYDNLIAMGRLQLGKELAHNEEYLLHVASMITLKQMKGMLLDIDDPTIAELKRIHKEHLDAGLIFTTPESEWYESARVLKQPYLPEEVQAEIDKANAITSNLILKSCEADKKGSNIEDEERSGNDVIDDMIVVEEGVAKVIQKDWVKLVPPETSNYT